MSITVKLVDGPLQPQLAPWQVSGAGAVVCFEGIVRPREGDAAITALEYEAYEPMASKMLSRLAAEATERFGLLGVVVEHSVGRVDAGACSFRLQIGSKHRKEGLAAMDWFIDTMKRDVPIWKSPIFAGCGVGGGA